MTKKDREALKYIEKQKEMNLVIISNLKENCKGMRKQEYNKIRRGFSEIILILDYIIMKLGEHG